MARPRTHKIWSLNQDQFAAIVAASISLAAVLRACGCADAPGEYKALRKRLIEDGLDTSHFRPYANHRSLVSVDALPLAEVLIEHSSYSRATLKRRLIREGRLRERCSISGCGIETQWNGHPIVLILDHINGVNDDNRIENLRLVCPNCNSQLETFAGRNVPGVRKRFPGKHGNLGKSRLTARRAVRPPYDKLCVEIETLGYCGVGRKYGVSDNAIRKWKRHYECGLV